jgi:L-rhamnose mutarotase
MKYCLALDLIDDETLIAEYEIRHKEVWPEVRDSIRESGITTMEIYRVFNRLFMIMETDEGFSFERKNALDSANPKVQQWEELMRTYQQAIPGSRPAEKWILMDQIFKL